MASYHHVSVAVGEAMQDAHGGVWKHASRALAAWSCGTLVSALSNPFWLLKSRMIASFVRDGTDGAGHGAHHSATVPQGRTAWSTSAHDPSYGLRHGQGMRAHAANVIEHGGVSALWRGASLSVVASLHGAITFVAYDAMKDAYAGALPQDVRHASVPPAAAALFGGLSKVFATIGVYPYQVVRTRLQVHERASLASIVRGIVREGVPKGASVPTRLILGASAFFRGLAPTLVRSVPASALSFWVYELCSRWL